MIRLLSFKAPAEEAFTRKRNSQLLRFDASWAVMWMLFQVVGVSKFRAEERHQFPWTEVAILFTWASWLPLLLILIRFRTQWYLRHRNTLMCCLRLCRTLMVMNSRLPWREAKYVGTYNTVPNSAWPIFLHLYWKTNLLFFGAVSFVTPMRVTIPLQLVSLLATLAFTAQRCRLECGVDAATLSWPLTASSWPQICSVALGSNSSTEAGNAACMAEPDPVLTEAYYKQVASWIGRLLYSPAHALGSGGQPGASCLGLCFLVHSWLQAVGGVLVPVALLWAVEERLRWREVNTWRQQEVLLQQQEQEEESLPPHTSQYCWALQPLSAAALVGWLACSAWLLWLGLAWVLI